MRVSHRFTHCDPVGRSKEQQTVVVTANNVRVGACLVKVGVRVRAGVLWSCGHAAE